MAKEEKKKILILSAGPQNRLMLLVKQDFQMRTTFPICTA